MQIISAFKGNGTEDWLSYIPEKMKNAINKLTDEQELKIKSVE